MKNLENKSWLIIFSLFLIVFLESNNYVLSQNLNLSSDQNNEPTDLTNFNSNNNIKETKKNNSIKSNDLIPKVSTSNRIGRREVSKVGLASIGIAEKVSTPSNINSLVWKNTDSNSALFLLKNIPAYGSSEIINELVKSIIIKPSVPPDNSSEEFIKQFVSEKLNWLAKSGKSDSLSEIISQLPNDQFWSKWKKWQIKYDLIKRSDTLDCEKIENETKNTLDMFWHKSYIMCLILSGENKKAAFKSDLLRHTGEKDENFFTLIDSLLNRKKNVKVDLENTSLFHLALMDAAHIEIPLSALQKLPQSMTQATKYFRYLDTEAQLFASYKRYSMNLNNFNEVELIWKSVVSPPTSVEEILDILQKENVDSNFSETNNFHSVLLWVALNSRTTEDTDLLVQAGFRQETRLRNVHNIIQLYENLIRSRLNEEKNLLLSDDIKKDYSAILTFANYKIPQHEKLVDIDNTRDARNILNLKRGMQWNAENFDKLNCWILLPLISEKGIYSPKIDWMKKLYGNNFLNKIKDLESLNKFIDIRPEYLFAIQQAISERSVARVVLLSSLVLKDYPLYKFNPKDAAFLVRALRLVELNDEAQQLADEFILSHLMNIYWKINN